MKKILRISAVVATALLCACSTTKEPAKNLTAEELYNQAYDYLEQTAYKKAAETFEKVELEHPYSRWATKSKLMAAYAYYRDKKYDDATIALDRFIKYHPGNKDIAYAYYMKGLCAYEQMPVADKAQDNTEEALTAFQQLMIRFPDSKYSADAGKKVKQGIDNLAAHEMTVGRFYLQKQNYLSALNRFSTVIKSYPQTPQIEEALYRQVEIFVILGMNDDAKKAKNTLKTMFPDSPWNAGAQKLVP